MEEYKVQIESWGPFAEGRNNMFQTAIKNHEELFPNHTSALKATDPELIEIFDNFAFDEVVIPEAEPSEKAVPLFQTGKYQAGDKVPASFRLKDAKKLDYGGLWLTYQKQS